MFSFTIGGLATFLDKSPVTIRSWERKGLLSLPRVGVNRSLTIDQVYDVAVEARRLGRIDDDRMELVRNAIVALRQIELENQ